MTEQNNEHRDWERKAAVAVSVVLLVALGAGLLLAIAGVFVPVVFAGVAVPVVFSAWVYFRPRGVVVSHRPGRRFAMGIAILIVLGVTILNVTSTAEHLQTNRDPGVYLTTGKWLATRGTLLVDGANAGFAGIENVSGWTGGYYDSRDDGLLYPQFNHGFPVMLALSNWVGGDRLMFNLNPLLGAAFLFFLFGFLGRFFREWVALVAVGTAAFNLVFWHFARDTYSEPLVALLLVLALLAIDDAVRFGETRRWLFAGLLVGTTALVRIDAWFYIAIFSGIIAIHSWLNGGNAIARFRPRDALVALGAVWAMGAIGFADLVLRSPGYLADLWPSAKLMLVAAAIGGFTAMAAVVLVSKGPRFVGKLRDVWVGTESIMRRIGAIGVVVFVAWALFWRPGHNIAHGDQAGLVAGLMVQEGVPANPTRSFFELSARWLTWYWGVVGFLVASVGWVLAVGRRHLADRRRLYVPLTLTGLALIPYIIDPSITPDQMWALRRFYPMGLIGLATAVAVSLGLLARWVREAPHRRWTEPLLIGAAAIVLVAVPGSYAAPLATASTQVGMYGSTMQLCAELPNDAVVLVEAGRLATIFPAAIRSFCNVPVASLVAGSDQGTVDLVGESWKTAGRSLYLVGSYESCVIESEPMASSQFRFTLPERTLTHRPAKTVESDFGWGLGRWGAETDQGRTTEEWDMSIRTEWAPPDSSSFVAIEGERDIARWWLEYRPSGILEFWVNTGAGPVGVGYPAALDDGIARTVPFGIDGEEIFIGCGLNRRSTVATGIVPQTGAIEFGQTFSGVFGRWKFEGDVTVDPRG